MYIYLSIYLHGTVKIRILADAELIAVCDTKYNADLIRILIFLIHLSR